MEIDELFEKYGTDKDVYASVYHSLFKGVRESISRVLEIGIGTLDPDANSSMVGWCKPWYRPGGSLRCWRDYFSNAEIHGVDVAPDTRLLGEPRITTHLGDSTNADWTADLTSKLGRGTFDVVVDDASHADCDQLATLRNFFPLVRRGGFYIVEDVEFEGCLLTSLWDEVSNVIGDDFCFVNEQKTLLVISRRSDAARAALGD